MEIPLKQYWDLLAAYLKPQLGRVIGLAFLLFSSIGMQLISPQILRYFIDQVEAVAPLNVLMTAALLFIGVALLQQGLTVYATYLGEKVGWTATNALRADLALHCLKLDMAFHNERTPGEFIERIDGDVANLAAFFSQFVVRILGSLMLLAGILLVLFGEDWRVGVVMTVYAAVTLIGLSLYRNVAVPFWKEARQASADLFGYLEERLAGTVDIRSNGATPYAMQRFYHFAGNRLRNELKASVVNIRLRYLHTGLYSLGQVLAVGAGYYLFQTETITLGTVFLLVYYTDILFRPLEEITRQMEDLQKAGAGIERISELSQTESQIKDGSGSALPTGPLSIDFDAVSFGYYEGDGVLHDLSFRLESGKVLGLLGRTGSGKTTITRLLFRLYDPGQGVIRLGDQDLRAAKLFDLRERVGMITQNVQLFRGTIRDNLTFFDNQISDDRILAVIQEIGLQPWFQTLPEGLDTMLQEDGGGLSAGEAQLLTFTRVFLKDPGLVILDEASSRLDPATEAQIEQAIDKLLENRTGIIIAHRLATVQRTDDILILENGQIQEYGDRQQLVDNPASRFSQLLQTGLTEVLQ